MNGKAPEEGKHKFHWLNVWLDLQILYLLVGLFSSLYSRPPNSYLPDTLLIQIMFDPVLTSAIGTVLIVCCVVIQLWRKWAVYVYFALSVAHTLPWAWMFLTWPDAPLKDMIWISAENIAFTFVLLFVTWLLVRPFWKQFR
jgi:hypothetical protein